MLTKPTLGILKSYKPLYAPINDAHKNADLLGGVKVERNILDILFPKNKVSNRFNW